MKAKGLFSTFKRKREVLCLVLSQTFQPEQSKGAAYFSLLTPVKHRARHPSNISYISYNSQRFREGIWSFVLFDSIFNLLKPGIFFTQLKPIFNQEIHLLFFYPIFHDGVPYGSRKD
jgi:hypothetical protein